MPYWAVAKTEPNRDAFAAASAIAAGFTVFAPRVRTKVASAWRVAPLFPSYLFVQIVDQWRILERTMGLSRMVRFGESPARCPDAEIEKLMARMDNQGLIALPPPPGARRRAYAKGDKVRIVGGAFDGLAGVHSGMSAAEREIILIRMLNAQRRIAIPAQLVRPA